MNQERTPVIIDGARTPFVRANGKLSNLNSVDLGRHAVSGLINKSGVPIDQIESVIMGTVIGDPNAPNMAREVSLGCGIPKNAWAYTVSLACVSSNVSCAHLSDFIRLGKINIGIAGGAETLSDFPIRHSKAVRSALIRLQKAKSPKDYISEFSKLSIKDLKPDVPTVTEYSTGLTMGQSCERLAKRIGVTRKEADEFAFRSHQNSIMAWEKGNYADDVLKIITPPKFIPVEKDDGPRPDTTMETLTKLRTSFDKKYGQITAGNSSFLTDGGSACLIASQAKATELGLKPKAKIVDYYLAGTDPLDDVLLGPSFVIPELLKRHNLKANDIGVWELHEAFASQLVACIKVMESPALSREVTGQESNIGEIPIDKVNVYGGSLALGHPFGATGARLVMTATRRLREEGARYALVSGCAAGGHGLAMLLENTDA